MAKYIVTGGAGFIGSHVAELLISEGHGVVVVDNLSTGKEGNIPFGVVMKEMDIRNREALMQLFAETEFDGVFHLAAIPRMQYSIEKPLLTHDVNINGTLNVLEAARQSGIRRVVYSASSSAYGTLNQPPFVESMRERPIIPYAVQKYVGELYCRTYGTFYGLETVCLRYFNVYGPRQTTNKDGPYATVIGIFLGQRGKGEPMTIVPPGTQRRDFTYVTDVADANILAMHSDRVGEGEVFNIGTGENHSVLEVAAMIGGETEPAPERQGEAQVTLADNAPARTILDWEPQTQFKEGILILKQMHGID